MPRQLRQARDFQPIIITIFGVDTHAGEIPGIPLCAAAYFYLLLFVLSYCPFVAVLIAHFLYYGFSIV